MDLPAAVSPSPMTGSSFQYDQVATGAFWECARLNDLEGLKSLVSFHQAKINVNILADPSRPFREQPGSYSSQDLISRGLLYWGYSSPKKVCLN